LRKEGKGGAAGWTLWDTGEKRMNSNGKDRFDALKKKEGTGLRCHGKLINLNSVSAGQLKATFRPKEIRKVFFRYSDFKN